MTKPKLFAHRGASAIAPENTLSAFQLAKAYGANWIECDVTLTKDNIPIIFHDKTLKRQTGIDQQINHLNYAELSKLDIGIWFAQSFRNEKIPTLATVLDWAKHNHAYLNLELKSNGYKPKLLAKRIAEVINKVAFPHKQLLISSFDIQSIIYIKSYLPEVERAYLMNKWQNKWLFIAKRLDVDAIHCSYKIITKRRANQIKKQGFKLHCYTVNNRKVANKLFRKGVDAIFTDNPNLLSSNIS